MGYLEFRLENGKVHSTFRDNIVGEIRSFRIEKPKTIIMKVKDWINQEKYSLRLDAPLFFPPEPSLEPEEETGFKETLTLLDKHIEILKKYE